MFERASKIQYNYLFHRVCLSLSPCQYAHLLNDSVTISINTDCFCNATCLIIQGISFLPGIGLFRKWQNMINMMYVFYGTFSPWLQHGSKDVNLLLVSQLVSWSTTFGPD